MSNRVVIQTFIGIAVSTVAITIFAFSIVRIVMSTEFHNIGTDDTITLTPDPERAYYIAARSQYKQSVTELRAVFNTLAVSDNKNPSGFTLIEAPGQEYSGRTKKNKSTHTSSVARINFHTDEPIILTVSSYESGPAHTLVLMSRVDVTMKDILVPIMSLLVAACVGSAMVIRYLVFITRAISEKRKMVIEPS